ncbi:MAG: hypothetical protein KF725_13815 [Cyclobacteriaceae bacterium]|nr:hypothetical protein [Cyclobacteriaceae bacterium]UYN85305.1 MAG: hypothetical protein KIT51_10395 [Cyclobacteriaceae bacterium]
MLKGLSVISMLMLLSACASFYEGTYEYNRQFEQGNLEQALKSLRSSSLYNRKHAQFLAHVNNGLLLSVMGRYEESNAYFEKAYIFGEDYRINYAREAASYLTNPTVTIYKGEDHEHLMLLYYKALNFVKMERYEDALVECRRLNIRLMQLSDRYNSPERYRRDAFIHNLMGIIYQANKDWNNAFIAYRNALEIYEEDYMRMFGVYPPDQLKSDLLTAAWNTGFKEEYSFYKDKFGWDDFTVSKSSADLIFFWHNGLGPVKDEWSINFMIRRSGDAFVFFNEHLGLSYTFPVANDDDRKALSSLEIVRVAFPRYVERPPLYSSAVIFKDDAVFPLELTEDINRIAFKSLQERMWLEFSKALIRVALKKAAAHSARKEDEGFGALIGMVNAITEKADTRNWQTLPHSILYTRVPLEEGTNTTRFTMRLPNGSEEDHSFTYRAKAGQTLFHTFTSLETRVRGR